MKVKCLVAFILISLQDASALSYLGCFFENQADFELSLNKASTPWSCSEKCSAGDFPYSAVQRRKCFCSTASPAVEFRLDESQCNVRCEEDGNEFCGGRRVVDVYANHNAPSFAGRVNATRYKTDLSDFLLGCSQHPLLCQGDDFVHVALFDESGDILQISEEEGEEGEVVAKRDYAIVPPKASAMQKTSVNISWAFRITPKFATSGNQQARYFESFWISTHDGKQRLVLDAEAASIKMVPEADLDANEQLTSEWHLRMIKGMYLSLEPVGRERHNVQVRGGKLAPSSGTRSSSSELFTGINTNFAKGISLVRSDERKSLLDVLSGKHETVDWAKVMREAGVDAYGAVEINYVLRNGSEGARGFVCALEWGFDDADVACRQLGFEAGMPVYGSVFTNASGSLVASAFKCDGVESELTDCPFKSVLVAPKDNTISQKRRLAEDEKSVFGCADSTGFKAGVVCGKTSVIQSIVGRDDGDIPCPGKGLLSALGREARLRGVRARAARATLSGDVHWARLVGDVHRAVEQFNSVLYRVAWIPWPIQIEDEEEYVRGNEESFEYLMDVQQSIKASKDEGRGQFRPLLPGETVSVKTVADLSITGATDLSIDFESKESEKTFKDMLSLLSGSLQKLKEFLERMGISMSNVERNSVEVRAAVESMLSGLEELSSGNNSSFLIDHKELYSKMSESCLNGTDASLDEIHAAGEVLDAFVGSLQQVVQQLSAARNRASCVFNRYNVYFDFNVDRIGVRAAARCNHELAVEEVLQEIGQKMNALVASTAGKSQEDFGKVVSAWREEELKQDLLQSNRMVQVDEAGAASVFSHAIQLKARWGRMERIFMRFRTSLRERLAPAQVLMDMYSASMAEPGFAGMLRKTVTATAVEVLQINDFAERLSSMSSAALGKPMAKLKENLAVLAEQGRQLREMQEIPSKGSLSAEASARREQIRKTARGIGESVEVQRVLVHSAAQFEDLYSSHEDAKEMLQMWDRFACGEEAGEELTGTTNSLLDGKGTLELLFRNAFDAEGNLKLTLPPTNFFHLSVNSNGRDQVSIEVKDTMEE